MKVLVLGDVFGEAGRNAVVEKLSILKARYKPNFIIVNAENATHGRVVSAKHAKEIFRAGANVITLGDKVWDYQADIDYFKSQKNIVRPFNLDSEKLNEDIKVFNIGSKKIAVLSFLGKTFMETERRKMTSPYKKMDKILEELVLGKDADAIIVDFHAEASSEKLCFAFKYDGKVSAVYGTHTHIPTADKRILKDGTGYITDVGMCGVQNSAIGMDVEAGIQFMQKNYGDIDKRIFAHPSKAEAGELSGVVFEIDDSTGKTINIEQILPKSFK